MCNRIMLNGNYHEKKINLLNKKKYYGENFFIFFFTNAGHLYYIEPNYLVNLQNTIFDNKINI